MKLTDITTGKPWPPETEKERLETYRDNRKLWKGDHLDIIQPILEKLDKVKPLKVSTTDMIYYTLNLPKRITTHWADMLYSEPPVITSTDESGKAKLEQIVKASKLTTVAGPQLAMDKSVYGDGLLRVTRRDNVGVIEPISPRYWAPLDDDTMSEPVGHVLAWTYQRERSVLIGSATYTQAYVRLEIHEPGMITHRAFILTKSGKLGRELELSELDPDLARRVGENGVEETEIEHLTVIPAHGLRMSEDYFGRDDYGDILPVVQGISARLSHIDAILDRHADPKMYGPHVQKRFNGERLEADIRGHYFEIEKDDPTPGYITWEAQLEHAFKEIEQMLELFYFLAETSPASFGQLKQGMAESGSALRRLMISDTHRVARDRASIGEAKRQAILVAGELMDVPNLNVSTHWFDGIPNDPLETATSESALVNSNLTDAISSMMRAHNITRTQAEEMFEQMLEQKARLAAFEPRAELELFGREPETE